jgi:hypothetical protein
VTYHAEVQFRIYMATHANFQHTPNKIGHSLAVPGQPGKREPKHQMGISLGSKVWGEEE